MREMIIMRGTLGKHTTGVNDIVDRLYDSNLYDLIGKEEPYGAKTTGLTGEIDAYAVHNGKSLSTILLFEYKCNNKVGNRMKARDQLDRASGYLMRYLQGKRPKKFHGYDALDRIVNSVKHYDVRIVDFYVSNNPEKYSNIQSFDTYKR